jgi:hypothetical protein
VKHKLKFCNGCEQQKVIFKNKMVDGVRHQLCANCARKDHKQLKVTNVAKKKLWRIKFTLSSVTNTSMLTPIVKSILQNAQQLVQKSITQLIELVKII